MTKERSPHSAAFSQKGGVQAEQAFQIPMGEKLGHDTIELGSFRRKAIGAVGLQFVRQVAAGNDDGPASQTLRRAGDRLAEVVMFEQRQSRKTDSDHGNRAARLTKEPQWNHCAMIEFGTAFAVFPGGDPGGRRFRPDRFRQCAVVRNGTGRVGPAERREASARLLPGRDVKIIPIHDGMRRQDDQNVGLQRRGPTGRFTIGVDGCLDSPFLSASDFRKDQRRMRHYKSSKN